MATLVSFHAHPDDEAITDRRHHGQGRRRRPPGGPRVRHPGRARRGRRRRARPTARRSGSGGSRRRHRAAEILGVEPGRVPRLRRLRHDGRARPTTRPARSGRPTSTRPPTRWPRSCARSDADVLTVYDDHGGYGHPDHIQVHRVGSRAAELAGHAAVYEATRTATTSSGRCMQAHARPATEMPGDIDREEIDDSACPSPASPRAVDVRPSSTASGGHGGARQPDRRRRRSSSRMPHEASPWRSAPSGSSTVRAARLAKSLTDRGRARRGPDRRRCGWWSVRTGTVDTRSTW